VHVAPGTYPAGFRTTVSGTASGRIRFISDTKWGAKLVPPASSTSNTAWDNRGDYIDIDGFDVDGTNTQSGTQWANGLWTGGSYTSIKNNHVHHIATASTCSNQGGSAIGTSYYYYGVDSDVINNVVHHIGTSSCAYVQGLYISTSGNVKNNIVYQTPSVAIHLWHDAYKINIVNNTVFSSYTAILVGGGEYYHISGPTDYINVSNNIVYNNVDGIKEHGTTGTHNTYTNNLVYQNSGTNWSLLNGNTHTGTISADPQFVSYSSTGSGDYHLKSTSPAVDKGSAAYAPPTDINGTPRPQGPAVDIGAYEYKAL
jgi:hypothetical protein